MNAPSSSQEVLCRLLAATWDPQAMPPAESVPWPEVLRLVEPSNVAAVVYAITRGIRESMPSDAQQALEQAFYRSARANIRCLRQLTDLWAALSSAGAPLLLLKGAALAQALYGDVALRPIADIDLAVPHQHVQACRQVLLALGYVPSRVEEQTGSLLAHSNQEQFKPPQPYLALVELHWHILDVPYYLRKVPMDWFWENTESLLIAGQPFRVLNPEANLIYLPAHLALHHRFHGLRSLLDLALLIARNRDWLNWDRIAATAQAFDLLMALRETLDRLAQCWPSLPIDEARRKVHTLEPSRTDRRLYRLLTAEWRSAPLYAYTTLVSLPDFAARARFVWVNLFPQPAYMMARYGFAARWQLPYWYLYRLTGGLFRFVGKLPQARRIDREPH